MSLMSSNQYQASHENPSHFPKDTVTIFFKDRKLIKQHQHFQTNLY